MSSSSSDSDEGEEEKRRLAQALDPDFMKNVRKGDQLLTNGVQNGVKGGDSEGPPVSKRSKLFNPNGVDSELFEKPYSLDVTPEGQRFIAKQLAKSLENSIKEKPLLPPVPCSTATDMDADSGIKLFASSKCRLTPSDLLPSTTPNKRRLLTKKTKKHKKKKSSNSSSSSSSSSSDSDSEKLKSVAVSADWVLHQK